MLDLSIGLLNPFEYASKDRKFVDWNPDLVDHKKIRLMLGTLPQASDVFMLRQASYSSYRFYSSCLNSGSMITGISTY
jgi:hypothetical protein